MAARARTSGSGPCAPPDDRILADGVDPLRALADGAFGSGVLTYRRRGVSRRFLMPSIASDAFVLRTYTLGETSKVVVLLTRERGKVRAVAKGARGSPGRYLSALEPLSEVRVGLHGRQGTELYRLGQCELLRSAFPTGSRDLETALALSYFAELLESFSQEGEAEDGVYRLAAAVLAAAEAGKPVPSLT